MQAITREFDDLMTELREGQPFSGESGEHRTPFVELRPALARLAADDRIYGTVEELLGPDFVWASSEGNITVGDHLWHPDRPGDEEEISYIRLKTMIYLDETTRDAGAIRLIPGSHRVPPARGDRGQTAPPAWADVGAVRRARRRGAVRGLRVRAWRRALLQPEPLAWGVPRLGRAPLYRAEVRRHAADGQADRLARPLFPGARSSSRSIRSRRVTIRVFGAWWTRCRR